MEKKITTAKLLLVEKKNKMETEKLLTIAEVAKMLRVNPCTIRNWSNSPLLHSFRLGTRGDRRFRQKDIDEFLKKGGENCNSRTRK